MKWGRKLWNSGGRGRGAEGHTPYMTTCVSSPYFKFLVVLSDSYIAQIIYLCPTIECHHRQHSPEIDLHCKRK